MSEKRKKPIHQTTVRLRKVLTSDEKNDVAQKETKGMKSRRNKQGLRNNFIIHFPSENVASTMECMSLKVFPQQIFRKTR
jgi:hypothetical protein